MTSELEPNAESEVRTSSDWQAAAGSERVWSVECGRQQTVTAETRTAVVGSDSGSFDASKHSPSPSAAAGRVAGLRGCHVTRLPFGERKE